MAADATFNWLFSDWRGVRTQVRMLRLMREDWDYIVCESPWLSAREAANG